MRKQFETVVLSAKMERETFKEENDFLKERIKEVTDTSLIDMELLKVKLAVLHGTDLKNLKDLYEMKLKHSSDNIVRMDE